MSIKNTLFYKQNRAYLLDFSAEEISSDSAMFLAEKIEHKHHIIRDINRFIIDDRDQSLVKQS